MYFKNASNMQFKLKLNAFKFAFKFTVDRTVDVTVQ